MLSVITFTRSLTLVKNTSSQYWEGWEALMPTRCDPLSGRCRPVRCRHHDGSQLGAGQTGQEFVGKAFGKASVLAALLLPSTTQWGQRETAPRPPDAWRQTHRRGGITESAGAALLAEPRSQTCSRPDRRYTVSRMASKAVLRKISLWLVRRGEEGSLFVVSRWVSTDYMCGLDLSGFGSELRPRKASANVFGFSRHHLKTGGLET